MIGDYFLDQCLTACCSLKDESVQTKEIISSIYYILKWFKEESNLEKNFANIFKDKFDIVFFLSQYRSVNQNFDLREFLEKMQNGKYKEYIPKIEQRGIDLQEDDVKDLKEKILSKRKICELLKGKKEVQDLLNDIESGNFVSEEEIISKWESKLSGLYQNVMKINSAMNVEKVSKLNLVEDDYSPVLDKIRQSLNPEDTLKTGFKCIDDKLPAKGFEERRLYLIGGSSGVGKSVFLLNVLNNCLANNISCGDKLTNYYLYITAENLIDESLLRFYCCSTKRPVSSVLEKLREDEDFSFKQDLGMLQRRSNSVVMFYYVESERTKVQDIESLVSSAVTNSKTGRLKGVFLDYLDLISPNSMMVTSDNKRIAQGEVSQELKNIAVKYSVPLITATQLNRSGYDVKAEPSLTQMGESMLKINNSDFVLFIQNTQDSVAKYDTPYGQKYCQRVRMTILKNRNGSVGSTVQLIMPLKLNDKDIFSFNFEECIQHIDNDDVMSDFL